MEAILFSPHADESNVLQVILQQAGCTQMSSSFAKLVDQPHNCDGVSQGTCRKITGSTCAW
jgi:hypothetical protein